MDRRSFLKQSALAAASIVAWPAISLPANADGQKILRMAYGAEVATLDPIKTVFGADIIIQGMMYARLLHANADRSEVGPGLAEKWEISEDGKTYTGKMTLSGNTLTTAGCVMSVICKSATWTRSN